MLHQYFILQILCVCLISSLKLFVEKGKCSFSSGSCNGTFQAPFENLSEALKHLEQNAKEGLQFEITIADEHCELDEGPSTLFRLNGMSLKISGKENKRTELLFSNSTLKLSFLVIAGSLSFENIVFKGVEPDKMISTVYLTQDKWAIDGLLNIKNEKEVQLAFKNCDVIGKFFDNTGIYLFSSFLFVSNKLLEQSSVTIKFEDVKIKISLFPKGVINTLSTKGEIIIYGKNMEIINCMDAKFHRWELGLSMSKEEEYFDFTFLLNNSRVTFDNIRIIDSSRFLFGDTDNTIELINVEIKVLKGELLPPEQIYLLKSNKLIVRNFSFENSSVASYDDVNNKEKDGYLMISEEMLAAYENFEKIQAIFTFLRNNTVNFSDSTVRAVNLQGKENFIFSIFNIFNKNIVFLKQIHFENILFNTEKDFGILCFFCVFVKNQVDFSDIKLSNITMFVYSIATFLFSSTNNVHSINNFTANQASLKLKATDIEVQYVLKNMTINPSYTYLSPTKLLKWTTLILIFQTVNLTLRNANVSDIRCVIGCLLSSYIGNNVLVANINITRTVSEALAAVLCLGLKNYLNGTKFFITEGRSNSGQLYAFLSNNVILKDAYFRENWGSGGFAFYESIISGSMCFQLNNTISLDGITVYKGISDKGSGAFLLYEGNTIKISNSNFEENESVGASSFGGVTKMNNSNTIYIFRCSFKKNYGAYGGVISSNYSNSIKIENCEFRENEGKQGAILHLLKYNLVEIIDSQIILNNGFVQGLIIAEANSTVFINNSCFLKNQVHFKGFMIYLKKNITLWMSSIRLDYEELGFGNFLFLLENNSFFARNFSVSRLFDFEMFLGAETKNTIIWSEGNISESYPLKTIFLLQTGNHISLENLKISAIIFYGNSEGLIKIYNLSAVYVKDCVFSEIYSQNTLLLSSISENIICFLHSTIANNELDINGSVFELQEKTNMVLKHVTLANFTGFRNQQFLIKMVINNTLISSFTNLLGFFYQEQSSIKSYMLKAEKFNILLFSGTLISSENPSNDDKTRLVFLALLAGENTVFIRNSIIKIKNYVSFLTSLGKNLIAMENVTFSKSLLFENLISLSFSSHFIGTALNLHSINVSKTGILLRAEGRSVIIFSKIGCGVISNFLSANHSTFLITKSVFHFKTQTKFDPVLNFIELFEGSLGFVNLSEFVLRESSESTLFFLKSSFLHSQLCIFLLNSATKGGVFKLMNETSLSLTQNKFLGNKALLGGVIFVGNKSNITVLRNDFLFNKALGKNNKSSQIGKGGCFYFEVSKNKNIHLIRANKFKMNGAEIGGIIYFQLPEPKREYETFDVSSENFILGSKARYYGPVSAGIPMENKLIKGSDLNSYAQSQIDIGEIPFSQIFDSCKFFIVSKDIFNQTILGEPIFSNRFMNFSGFELQFSLLENVLCFSSFHPSSHEALRRLVGEPLNVEINTSSIAPALNYSGILLIKMKIKKCQIGEYYDLGKLKCTACEPNFFSFDDDFLEQSYCKSCASENFYCYGGFNLSPKAGYWRSSFESKVFFECPIKSGCVGDLNMINSKTDQINNESYVLTSPSGYCGIQYQGALCHACRRGFTKYSALKCVPCGSHSDVILMITGYLCKVLVCYYIIFRAISFMKNLAVERNSVILNFLIKTIVGHFQFIRLLLILFPDSYPKFLLELVGIVTSILISDGGSAYGVNCSNVISPASIKYAKTILNILYPFAVYVTIKYFKIFGFCREFFNCLLRRKKMKISKPRRKDTIQKIYDHSWPSLNLICIMIFLDSIIISLSENLHEINIGDDRSEDFRVVSETEIRSREGFHLFWKYFFIWPSLCVYAAMIPAFLIVKIFKKNKIGLGLDEPETLLRYGYFYYAYNRKLYFYEAFYIGRKLTLIFIDVFFVRIMLTNKPAKSLILLLVLLVFFFLAAHLSKSYQPFDSVKYNILNKVEHASFLVQSFTCFFVCFNISLDLGGEVQNNPSLILIFKFLILLSNIVFLLFWLKIFLNSLEKSFQKFKFCSFLKKCVKKIRITYKKFRKKADLPSQTAKKFNRFQLSEKKEPNETPAISQYMEKIRKLTLLNNLLISQIEFYENQSNEIYQEGIVPNLVFDNKNEEFHQQSSSKPAMNEFFEKPASSESNEMDLEKETFSLRFIKRSIEGDNFCNHYIIYKYEVVGEEQFDNFNLRGVKSGINDQLLASVEYDALNSSIFVGLRFRQPLINPNLKESLKLRFEAHSRSVGRLKVCHVYIELDAKNFIKLKTEIKWRKGEFPNPLKILQRSLDLKTMVIPKLFGDWTSEHIIHGFAEILNPVSATFCGKFPVEVFKTGRINVYGATKAELIDVMCETIKEYVYQMA